MSTLSANLQKIAYELLNNNKSDSKRSLDMLSRLEKQLARRSPHRCIAVNGNHHNNMSPLTEPRLSCSSSLSNKKARTELLWNEMTQLHPRYQNKHLDNNGWPKRNRCNICKSRKTSWKCVPCNVFICHDEQANGTSECYQQHVKAKHPNLKFE